MKIGNLLQDPKYAEKFVLQKLLCLFLSCSREELWTDVDREVDDEMVQKVRSAYDDYTIKKKPLEYILWHVDFFGREFIVNEATLIPRPETEYMITAVSEFIKSSGSSALATSFIKGGTQASKKNVLLDIGTGCGVLGISVLLQNPWFFQEAIFTDYYANALAVAKENYASLVKDFSWKVEFIESDLLTFVASDAVTNPPVLDWARTSPLNREGPNSNIILVANLPYIPEWTFDENVADNVKKYEPRMAFISGQDGLDDYRRMFEQLLRLKLENWGLSSNHLMMFLEMMTWQVDILRAEFGDRMVFEEVKTFHFNIRIVKAWLR